MIISCFKTLEFFLISHVIMNMLIRNYERMNDISCPANHLISTWNGLSEVVRYFVHFSRFEDLFIYPRAPSAFGLTRSKISNILLEFPTSMWSPWDRCILYHYISITISPLQLFLKAFLLQIYVLFDKCSWLSRIYSSTVTNFSQDCVG